VSANGTVLERPRAYCIYERIGTVPSWRHACGFRDDPRATNARGQLELVVRIWINIGNFDYALDYVFTPRGAITVQAAITGVLMVQPTSLTSVDPFNRFRQANGVLVAPNALSVFNSQFVNFRIDIDIDAPFPNRFVREAVVKQKLPQPSSSGRTSMWTVYELPVQSEQLAVGIPALDKPGLWNFRHGSRKTHLGNPIGMKVWFFFAGTLYSVFSIISHLFCAVCYIFL
jgi:primary-amine oxidase